MPLDIRALIFDLDGVITDTAEYHYLGWKRLADEEGIAFTRKDNEALRGVSRRESLNRMLKGRAIDEATAQRWMERKNNYYLQLLEQLTPAHRLSGVNRLLDDARHAGLRIGLGSASKNARPVLAKLGLADAFDAVGDGYCVVNAKPKPDLFVWVAGRLAVYPGQAVVFEDAEAGIDAALAGGFWAVGIGQAAAAKAHVHYSAMPDVVLEDVIASLNRRADRLAHH